MGLLSGSMETLARGKSRTKSDATAPSEQAGGNPDDTSTLDKEEGNILMSIIQQRSSPHVAPCCYRLTVVVRPGMDLSKIALPTFVLEPRSLLERITDFFSHPELIFG